MYKLKISEARKDLAEIVNKVAYQGARIVLHRRGKDVAVIMPISDLQTLEELEDRLDAEEADRRLDDPNDAEI
ncbi:MAG: type II toxin-antitoxin system Phd/YefM family antitoxin, partial [Pseudomonadota bacterium]